MLSFCHIGRQAHKELWSLGNLFSVAQLIDTYSDDPPEKSKDVTGSQKDVWEGLEMFERALEPPLTWPGP